MSVDSLLDLLGSRNVIVYVWYFIINFLRAFSSSAAFMAFLWANAKPNSFRCKLPFGQHPNGSVPYEMINGKWMPSQCLQYRNFSALTSQTEPCQLGYVYEGHVESSIVTEWNLVCDRNHLAALADSSFFILSILTSSLFTALGDRSGRRSAFILCLLSLNLLGFLQTFSPNPYIYIVFRLLLGSLQQGTYALGYCYSLELFPRSRRSVPALMAEMMWVLSCCILSLIVFFVRHWRVYYYVTTLPLFPSIALIWLMPKSIPWLFAKGKTDEAFKTLRNMTKFMKNKEEVIQIFETGRIKEETLKTERQERQGNIYPFYFVITQRQLQRWTMVNAFVWLSLGLTYYAYNVYGTTFGNVYMNFFLLSIIEIPAVLSASYIGVKFGRKLPAILSLFTSGIIIFLLILGVSLTPSLVGLNVFLVVTGRLFASAAFSIIYLHTTEMYPTSLRSVGFTFGSSAARVGVVLLPFVKLLDGLVNNLPSIIIVGLSLISACLYCLLPETRLWKLPQTLEDVRTFLNDPRYQKPVCSCNYVAPEDDAPHEADLEMKKYTSDKISKETFSKGAQTP